MADAGPVPTPVSGWSDPAQVGWYVGRIGRLEARRNGERVLAGVLPPAPERVLDLGCGDGRLAALVLAARPSVQEVLVVDWSPPMLERARARFAHDPRVEVREWDLNDPVRSRSGDTTSSCPASPSTTSTTPASASCSPRWPGSCVRPVPSSTWRSSSRRRRSAMPSSWPPSGGLPTTPEDRLAAIEDQLDWMRAAGFADVECLWRWRGFALLVGEVS